MSHTQADHDDPNYIHTVDDLAEHEYSDLAQYFSSLTIEEFIGLKLNGASHCERCIDCEDEVTLSFINSLNDLVEIIGENYTEFLSLVHDRTRIIAPRILAVHPPEDAQSPSDPDTSGNE
jgi:hypothetical protein